MMNNNINKASFNENLRKYLAITGEEANRYFDKHIYRDLKAIAHNATYTYQFNNELLCYEDVESELVIHFLKKKEYLISKATPKTNFYNLIFTMFKMKFIDILRSHKIRVDRKKVLDKLAKGKLAKEKLKYDLFRYADLTDEVFREVE